MTVDLLGYALAVGFAVVLVWFAVRERRWWSWLQLAGIVVLVVAAVGASSLPPQAELVARVAGPALLVGGLLAWRLHWDAGWFGGDELHPPSGDAAAERGPDPRSDDASG